jgi:LysR family transcriptional regulator, nod-box dependent transcriptional activator
MDLQQFDLNLLVALDALLTEKSVTRAGTRMNLSQSAMSGTLARLRDVFHDELLIPVGRGMVLTPLAQDLVQPLRDLLQQVRSTLATRPRFTPATSDRHFSISVSDYVASVLIVDLLRLTRVEAPSITFELRSVGTRAGDDLDRDSVDFVIAPEGYVSPAHSREVLFEDTHTCIAWADNPHVGSTLSIDQYLSLGHVVVRVSEDGDNYDERILRGMNHRRRVEVVTPSFDLAPHLVVGTGRIATIATRLAVKYSGLLPIKLVPVPIEMPPMVEMLQWHRAHDDDPAHIWLRARMRDAVAALAPPMAPPTPQRREHHRTRLLTSVQTISRRSRRRA